MYIDLKSAVSSDGSVKYRLGLQGSRYIESVVLKNMGSFGLCLSSQIGCKMGCAFCATGLQRDARNLSDKEIFDQARLVLDDVAATAPPKFITLAGMGEPLANYENSLSALELIGRTYDVETLSLSTVGLVDQIKRLRHERRKIRLYVSLHGADNETRRLTMPMAKHYDIQDLITASADYAEHMEFGEVQISYLLLPGINDGEDQQEKLIQLLAGKPFVVQILLWNFIPGLHFLQSAVSAGSNWVTKLLNCGVPAYLMPSRGADLTAGCGQLITQP